MTIGLRLRIILGLFWAVLVAIATGAALEFYQLRRVSSEVLEHDFRLVASATDMLVASDGPPSPQAAASFERAFALAHAAAANHEIDVLETIRARHASYQVAGRSEEQARKDLHRVLHDLISQTTLHSIERVEAAQTEAATAALGLAVLCAALLLFAAWPSRVLSTHFFDPLHEIDEVARAVLAGEPMRRVSSRSDGELARLADAINALLDEHEQREGELRGRLGELRALVTSILHRWPQPACVTGIDGEVLVSTLSSSEEADLLHLTPRIRSAARVLLSRGFASAEELTTQVNLPGGRTVHLQSLALGEKRIVGWLATFHATAVEPPPPPRSGEGP